MTLDQITPREGIAVSGSVRNLILRGNQIRNCDVAIRFYGKALPIPFTLLDVTVIDNDLSDWKIAGIRFDRFDTDPGTPLVVPAQRVSILNNRGDGDPDHWNRPGVVRMPLGKWANTTVDITVGTETLAAGYGAFIDATGLAYVMIAGNHVRNAPQLVAGLDPALHTMEGNVGYCNPVQVAWHANNVGLGILIDPPLGWRYVIEGGNPTFPSWGLVLNTCPLAVVPDTPNPSGTSPQYALAVPPVTDKWVAGTFVRNLDPRVIGTGSTAYEIVGWRRITTGSANTLGTDWRQQRVLTG